MLEEWLIDGYNLLHSISFRKKNSKTSRETLFDQLAGFASSGNRKVLMMLDGRGDESDFEAYRTESFDIVYAQAVTADSAIERILFEKKGTHSFIVVTEDRALTQMARGLGFRVMASREFAELLKASSKANDDILFKEQVKSHGFNRPFEKKLRSPGESISDHPKK